MTRFRAMSYNVRYDNRKDHHDAWYARRDGVVGLVRFHRPDVIGFQEPVPEQRRDLQSGLPDYAFVGHGRDMIGADGDGTCGNDGEGVPLAVRTDRWTVREHGTFWLSETPERPSIGWDAAYPRIATWAHVSPSESPGSAVANADRSLLVVNTHLDHEGERARRESAVLIRERLDALVARLGNDADATDLPVVLLGDFNSTPGTGPHRILTGSVDGLDGVALDDATDPEADPDTGDMPWIRLRDAASLATVRHGPATSLTDFADLIDGRRIDNVLVSSGVEVEAFATLADRDARGRYPSDHLPVLARLRIEDPGVCDGRGVK